MNLAYASDARMRINVGIRRRLAPLVDNSRRRIELLNSLLLSFPGTPIMYYGDEIGMGDNIYLGDRNGVRTPMQWNSDRNAGFSKAVPAQLYFPVIMDPIWGYQSINVEAQLSDQSSLLHWTRNMIALRKLFHVFGRGTQEFLNPENRKILAYIRQYDDGVVGVSETILCVANLSRFSQPVSLDLAKYTGMIPVEMLGYVTFPTISAQPYPLTLAPYSFLWLELQPAPAVPEPANVTEAEPILDLVTQGIEGLLTPSGLPLLEKLLVTYLPNQRWFGAKSRTIAAVRVIDWVNFPNTVAALLFLEVSYTEGPADTYQLPLALSPDGDAETIRSASPASVLATITTSGGPAVLYDAVANEDFRQALLSLIETGNRLPATLPADSIPVAIPNAEPSSPESPRPSLAGHKSTAFASLRGDGPLPARTSSAEQSNTSILYDAKLILKLFRRIQPGENPDAEIGRFLTEVAHFPRIAPFLGDIRGNGITTLAMLQGLVENEGDGWQWTLNELSHFYDNVAILPPPQDTGHSATFLSGAEAPALAREHAWLYLDAAALLGRRTAEMHLALATPTRNAAFAAECFTTSDLLEDADRIDAQLTRSLDALKRGMSHLTETTADNAALVLSRRLDLFARARAIASATPTEAGERIRIHGDYHLGQVLRARGDFVILDFEGEPARNLSERRAKQSPLRDVAGMLRSFSYAAFSGLNAFAQRRPPNNEAEARNLDAWARLWQNAVSTEFLRAYNATVRPANPELLPSPSQAQLLLDAYLLEKSLYELLYELDNRPTWVRIPLAGILSQ
jgi:maltose alpha-D-glucosyltransferase/alpha-amylase